MNINPQRVVIPKKQAYYFLKYCLRSFWSFYARTRCSIRDRRTACIAQVEKNRDTALGLQDKESKRAEGQKTETCRRLPLSSACLEQGIHIRKLSETRERATHRDYEKAPRHAQSQEQWISPTPCRL